jgi:hypothetical protein
LREPNHKFATFILHKCLHDDFRTGAGSRRVVIHAEVLVRRHGRYNQNGILLQIRCRWHKPRQSMQFLIVVSGKEGCGRSGRMRPAGGS